jgi:type IV secretory pathway VirB3-like protein
MAEEKRGLQADPLFKGCTRPAMIMGVPFTPMMIMVMVVMLIAGWSRNMLLIGLAIPLWAVMRGLVRHDDQMFRLLGLRFKCRSGRNRNRNAVYWGGSSYSAVRFTKREGKKP